VGAGVRDAFGACIYRGNLIKRKKRFEKSERGEKYDALSGERETVLKGKKVNIG